MRSLPKDAEPPKRLGRMQARVYHAVLDAAQAFDWSLEPLDPAEASATFRGIARAYPGMDGAQIDRAAASLVARNILRVSRVGWALHQLELIRLQQQRLRELTGPET